MSDTRRDGGTAAGGGGVWCPPGLRLPKVGDRVRIRLSGECEFEYPDTGLKHHPGLDGAIGVIDDRPLWGIHRCRHTDHDPSHRYTVTFEPAAVVEEGYRFRRTVLAQCFAAIELVPLAADDDAAPAGDGRGR
jgi:hypothetical protein